MKIQHLACIAAVSALTGLSSTAFAQMSGQSGDNTSGRVGTSSESTINRKDEALKPQMPQKDGVTMYNKHVYIVKDGMVTRAPSTKTQVADGLYVESATIWKDGQKVDLQDGQMMTFDGNMIDAPKQVQDRASATLQGPITDRP